MDKGEADDYCIPNGDSEKGSLTWHQWKDFGVAIVSGQTLRKRLHLNYAVTDSDADTSTDTWLSHEREAQRDRRRDLQ